MADRHLITVDELRAAGALDVPPAWRKSLGEEKQEQRDLFSYLSDDDDPSVEEQAPVASESDGDGSEDELT